MRNYIYMIVGLFLLVSCGNPDMQEDNIIVIDAGHGGMDSGAVFGRVYEKDAVLQITKKLGDELEDRGYKVYLTRDSDRFIKLKERTHIADLKNAKVFISIHANAISDRSRFDSVEGVETYFLQKSRDARSQRIALRENASVLQGTDNLSKNVIIDSVLNGPKIIQSHKLAIDVQNGMMKSIKRRYSDVKNGGVRPAPFYVLVGASRPSILVEVGYITNPKERTRLFNSSYQDRVVDGIVDGVDRYLSNRKKELGF